MLPLPASERLSIEALTAVPRLLLVREGSIDRLHPKMARDRERGAQCVLKLLFFLIPLVFGQQLSSRECENLGFTGMALCSDCNTFAEFVKSEELVSDCRKCCTEDSDDSMNKITYASAIIEVCMRKLVFYPELVGFIEEEKDQFPFVKVEYQFGSPPRVVLLDDNGEQKESIRIDNWKREHIRQFLQEKVRPGGSAS